MVKCLGKEGGRYGSEAVKSFENWILRVDGYREAVIKRKEKEEKMRA